MKKLDTRALLTYGALGLVGLFLLILVTPNLWGSSALPWLTVLFSLLPLAVLIALVVMLFGKSKPTAKPQSAQVSRLLGITAATATTLSVVLTYVSVSVPPTTTKFVLENTGVALLFLAYACTIILMNRQKFLYWPFWNSNDKRSADERQQKVRLRVFERAYIVNLVAIIIVVMFGGASSQRLHDELFQAGILCLLGLPAIIASWQKDS